MSKKYIHYGHDRFNLSCFNPIKNRPLFNKPDGGLWASPCESTWNWREWCEGNGFHLEKLKSYFIFTLHDDARVLMIKSREDLDRIKILGLCIDYSDQYPFMMNEYYPNFEELLERGYDAIEVYIQDTIYMDLYGWDCDSLLVLNPNCVIVVK